MQGWWVKSFGIDNLKIGPEVTLSIEIVYAQFVATGTSGGFGVSSGRMVGAVEAFLAMDISEDPKRAYDRLPNKPVIDVHKGQLLFGEVKNLDVSDVVEFAGTLVQQDIPKISNNLLKFEDLTTQICPFGIVVGPTVYPQGFSFVAFLVPFEKHTDIKRTADGRKETRFEEMLERIVSCHPPVWSVLIVLNLAWRERMIA